MHKANLNRKIANNEPINMDIVPNAKGLNLGKAQMIDLGTSGSFIENYCIWYDNVNKANIEKDVKEDADDLYTELSAKGFV